MNLYDLLEIGKDATKNEIKTAFIKKIKTFHPDKSTEDSDKKAIQIINAYKTLFDEINKRKYDEHLSKTDYFKEGYAESIINIENQNELEIAFECNQCGDINSVSIDILPDFNIIECESCCYKFMFDQF